MKKLIDHYINHEKDYLISTLKLLAKTKTEVVKQNLTTQIEAHENFIYILERLKEKANEEN